MLRYLYSFFFTIIVSSSLLATAESLHSFAYQWHEAHVSLLTTEEKVMLAQLIKAYENAAHYDAQLRRELLILQKLTNDTQNTSGESQHHRFVQLAAHVREITEKLLPAYEMWYNNWQICAEDVENTTVPALKNALQILQLEGRKQVTSFLEESRNSMQNEVVFSSQIFDTIAHDLASYAPLYGSLFADPLDLPFSPIEQDFDMALRITGRVEQHIESLYQATTFTKIIGITLELKTKEFMAALFELFSDAVKAEVKARFELYQEETVNDDAINPLAPH